MDFVGLNVLWLSCLRAKQEEKRKKEEEKRLKEEEKRLKEEKDVSLCSKVLVWSRLTLNYVFSRNINVSITQYSFNQSISVYSVSKLRKQKLRGFCKNLKSNRLQRLVDIVYNKIWCTWGVLVKLYVNPSLDFILFICFSEHCWF